MEKIFALLVCLCFIGVFQISETYAKDCERKEPKPCTSNSDCTPGVSACLKKKKDSEKKCYPCRCRNQTQCTLDVNTDKPICTCDAGYTGDYCECPFYTPPECPANWIKQGTSCYYFSEVEYDDYDNLWIWNDGKEYCESFGASLLKDDDKDKHDFIKGMTESGQIYWNGGTCSDVCQWPDGEIIPSSGNNTFWDEIPHQGCVMYSRWNDLWYTTDCTDENNIICEKNL